MNNQDVKNLMIRAMGMPSRKSKAKGLERAFIANILVTRDIRNSMSQSDNLKLDLLMTDETNNSPKDATPECAMWVESSHPQLAVALTQGAVILEIIESMKYWRDLGFGSFEEFDATIENENWLVAKVNELHAVNN